MKVLDHHMIQLTPAMMDNRVFRVLPYQPRTPGIHVQAVNKYLAVAAGKLKDNGSFPGFSETHYPLLPAMGVAWENLWASLYDEETLIWQPGEYGRDGIFGTPDGLFIDREEGTIAECKLTYKRHAPVRDEWLYLRQGLAYCALLGMRRVEYHVLWALGEYQRPYSPLYDATLVEFTNEEIESWFSRMTAVKDKVAAE